MEICEF
jgi:hypothetical protein